MASTKRFGWEGEQAVSKDLLINQDLDVYQSVVDDNLCDLVVDTGNKLKRVQVKAKRTLRGTCIEIKLAKYIKSKIDVIAVWYQPKDIIAYVPYRGEDHLLLAVETAKNKQEKGRNWFYRYMEFPL